MKSFIRYALLIGVTAAVTLALVVGLFGSPSAEAQPAQPAQPPAPAEKQAPPVTTPVDKMEPEPADTGGRKETDQVPVPAAGSAPAPAAGSAAPAAGAPAAAAPAQKAWYEELATRPIMEDGTFWMPKSVNKIADDSDSMFYAVLGLSAFFFFAITFAVVYFVIKYRHRPGHKAEPSAGHNDALEITWTVIPTIITVFLFYYGWRTYVRVVTPPQKAVEINVLAWRWNWQFTHQNGVTDSDLHVPVDTPVRLVMTSKDVLHAFYAPVLRVKQDIIPRRYTYVWFHATKPGTYRLTCAEYCGTDHSQMGKTADKTDAKGNVIEPGRRAVLVVHEKGKYEQYLAENQPATNPEDRGRRLYEKKGCNACHSLDGSTKIGPTFKGAWGSNVTLTNGSTVPFDENYVRESLLAPNAKSRPGFPAGTMPSFEGQLKEADIEGIIAWLKTVK